MKAFWTILAIAGGVVLLVLIGVAIAVWTVDVNQFVAPVQAKVKSATGRELEIGGKVKLSLGLEPKIVFDDVRFGNAPWAKDKQFASVKHVEAEVALLPLLKKRFEVIRLTLVEPNISLETGPDGKVNWDFGGAGAPAPGAASAIDGDESRNVIFFGGPSTTVASPVSLLEPNASVRSSSFVEPCAN